jgi:hypothetical protein
LVDKGPSRGRDADGADRASGDIEEITAGCSIIRCGSHVITSKTIYETLDASGTKKMP